MEVIVIVALLLIGAVLFAVEFVVAPGISVSGVGAVVSLLGAVVYSFLTLGTEVSIWVLLIAVLEVVGLTVWFMKSRTIDRLSLKKSLDYCYNPLENAQIKEGDKGTALTRLAQIGNVEINGKVIEARSAGGFIEEGMPVQVARIEHSTVIVIPVADAR